MIQLLPDAGKSHVRNFASARFVAHSFHGRMTVCRDGIFCVGSPLVRESHRVTFDGFSEIISSPL